MGPKVTTIASYVPAAPGTRYSGVYTRSLGKRHGSMQPTPPKQHLSAGARSIVYVLQLTGCPVRGILGRPKAPTAIC